MLYNVKPRDLVETILAIEGYDVSQVWYDYIRECKPLPNVIGYYVFFLLTAYDSKEMNHARGLTHPARNRRSPQPPSRRRRAELPTKEGHRP